VPTKRSTTNVCGFDSRVRHFFEDRDSGLQVPEQPGIAAREGGVTGGRKVTASFQHRHSRHAGVKRNECDLRISRRAPDPGPRSPDREGGGWGLRPSIYLIAKK